MSPERFKQPINLINMRPTIKSISAAARANAIGYAKRQVATGTIKTNYAKVLIIGNANIYWAHPAHQHGDYNKSVAMPNTEANRHLAQIINAYLTKHI